MKLYLECNMGAAGDMLMAALYELLDDKDAFIAKMRALNLPGVEITPERAEKQGIYGTHMRVTVRGAEETEPPPAHTHTHTHTHEHTHTKKRGDAPMYNYPQIVSIIRALDLPESVIRGAVSVYTLIAEAEARVHGGSADTAHFHEVGAMDAVADIVGVCLALDMLGAHDIAASPVHVGYGFVRCSHGVMPVPAPATALLLQGIPIYGGDVRGELCTPTGAALLKHFVTRFGVMEGTPAKIGYGMGAKNFERLNAVRAFGMDEADGYGEIAELTCNIDDMTGEAIGFAAEELLAAGAADVFLTPIYMKKSRPATMLTVLCGTADEDKFTRLMFKLTATLGVRVTVKRRAELRRETVTRQTPLGDVRVKISEGFGVRREKAEYDDLARILRGDAGAIDNG